MSKATRCIVIGQPSQVGPVKKMLEDGNVPSRQFELNGSNHDVIVRECKKESELKVIAVFTSEMPESNLAILEALRGSLKGVAVQVFRGGDMRSKPSESTLRKMGAMHIHSAFPLSSLEAVVVLKRKWFPEMPLPPEAEHIALRVRREELQMERNVIEAFAHVDELGDDDLPEDESHEIPQPTERDVQVKKKESNRKERRSHLFVGKPRARATGITPKGQGISFFPSRPKKHQDKK